MKKWLALLFSAVFVNLVAVMTWYMAGGDAAGMVVGWLLGIASACAVASVVGLQSVGYDRSEMCLMAENRAMHALYPWVGTMSAEVIKDLRAAGLDIVDRK